MKRFFIPPILPMLMVLALSFWVVVDETSAPPRMIDGQPDDAPAFAAAFMIVFTPVFYVIFALLNLLDACFDKLRGFRPWLASEIMTVILVMIMTKGFYNHGVKSSLSTAITTACVIAIMAIWPMCLLRRLVFLRRNKTA